MHRSKRRGGRVLVPVPLTLWYKSFGAAAEVINWGVRNWRCKGGRVEGGGGGDGDANAGNHGVANVLVVLMMMKKMAVLMDLIISTLNDSLIGVRWGGVDSQSQSPLTLFYDIFGAAVEVINWGIINRCRKGEVGDGGGGCKGYGDGKAGNPCVVYFLSVLITMTKMAVPMDLILSWLVDSLRGVTGGGVEFHSQSPFILCYEIFGAASKVVNWGVINRRRKG